MKRVLKRVAVLVSSTTLISSLLITAGGAAIFQLVTSPATVLAYDTDTYTWPSAPCEFAPNGGTSCTNPTTCTPCGQSPCTSSPNSCNDMYDWYENGGSGFSGTDCWYNSNTECFDPTWKFQYRNCTDYVAEKIYQMFGVNITSSWGNANNWLNYNSSTAHYPTDPTSAPQVGDIAVWTGGSFGHVAYVAAVSGSTATFDEYNENSDGNYTNNLTTANHGTPNGYIHIGTIPSPPSNKSLANNGGFNNGLSPWAVAGSAHYATYTSSSSYEGTGYGSTNSQGSGGGIYQDVSMIINAGDTFCSNAEATTDGGGSGGGGSLVLWMMGGSSNENSGVAFNNLPVFGTWTTGQTCITATMAHTSLRIQFYPTINGPTVDLDAIDAYKSFANNGGFNNGLSPWAVSGAAHYATYTSSSSYEGTGYGSTNSQGSGGGIYQDVTLSIASGDTYCANVRATTDGGGSGGGGGLVLWMLGGTNENSSVAFNNLPVFGTWSTGQTCVTATSAHTSLRIQFYPNINGPTVDLDALSVSKSLAKNGGFNNGLSTWAVSGSAHYATYTSSSAYEGTGYGSTNSQGSGGGIYEDVSMTINAGDTYCANTRATTDGTGTGGGGGLVLWMLGGTSENSSVAFSNLPALSSGQWTAGQTCITATSAHTSLRIQFYPNVNGPTVDLDALGVD